MAEIAPFRGILYDTRRAPASAVLAPPYDVINAEGRAALAARHEHNCVRLILPEVESDGAPGAAADKYEHAGALLRSWLAEGVLVRDDTPAIYRYHQVFTSAELGAAEVVRRGFIAAVRLHRFDEGIILPHERTLKGPKADRLALMKATGAHLSQIFTMYSDPDRATDRAFVEVEGTPPDLDGTTDDGTRHIVWRVTDRVTIDRIASILAPRQLYIADGHHRYETMLALREHLRARAGGALAERSTAQFGTLFLANMDDPGLVVLPTHRLIHSVVRFSVSSLLAAARHYFTVTTVLGGSRDPLALRTAVAEAAGQGTSFGAVWPGSDDAAVFTLRVDTDLAAVGVTGHRSLLGLDVTILHGLVLEKLLGIDRAAQDAQSHIEYIKDTRQALERTAAGHGQICFIMNPTPVDQVKAVSDAGEVMPQKSTFFYPKIASGVVINPVDPDETL
jgi:uncharacterized protein (DUF1015 family)